MSPTDPRTGTRDSVSQSYLTASLLALWLTWRKIERQLERIADRANPILVKETRQALKSRQFISTFLLILAACWIASLGGMAIIGPQIYYAAAGSEMLLAYYAILAFPLTIIVPYSAYRSLATEQEENTYELLSITALSPSQIVNGKLGSAMVQMLIYLSAVSPCIAFTLLLRGVEPLTVAVLLLHTVLGSMGLSMLAILAGAVSRVNYSQILVSVGLVLILTWTFGLAMASAATFVYEGYSTLRERSFWIANLAVLTFYFTTFALAYTAATARLSFASANRSTPLRWAMLIQQACFLGWMAALASAEGGASILATVFASGFILGIYWYLMGTLLTGEWPHLSQRVQRTLPQSTLGRMLFTWFNPGAGTGYLFSVANLTAVVAAGLIVLFSIKPSAAARWPVFNESAAYFLVIGWGYVVAFLGLGRLLINITRRFTYLPLAGCFLLHLVLLMMASGLPLAARLMVSRRQFSSTGSVLEITNPFLTLEPYTSSSAAPTNAPLTTIMVLTAALVVLLLNLRSVVRELQHHRIALPERVVEEEAALHPPQIPAPSNPWEHQ